MAMEMVSYWVRKSTHPSFWKNAGVILVRVVRISLTPISAPRIFKFRDALSPKAIAVFYFSAKPRA
jgi:hypothetical protein